MGNIALIGGVSELPAGLTALQNGRWRFVRKIPVQGAANVEDKTFEPLGSLLHTIYQTKEDEKKFQNLVLVAEESGSDIVNRASAYVITKSYETLTGEFVGEIDDVTDYEINGLKRTRRTLIAKAGTATTDYVVGTQEYGTAPIQYLAAVRIEENDAFVRVLAEYLQAGVVSRTTRSAGDGLREVAVKSFYEQNAPAVGIVTSVTEENENGYPVWVTTVLQKDDGTSPISGGAAVSLSSLGTFLYPGRAKPFFTKRTFGSGPVYFFDVYQSPPVESIVDATTEISYSATGEIGSLANPLWNPTEWAVVRSSFVQANDAARSKVEGLRGYRTETGSTMEIDGTSSSFDPGWTTSFGWTIFGIDGANVTLAAAEGPILTVEGGPEAPGGNTYTISYKVSEAFSSFGGTQYYKHMVTYATIPAQAALPV